MSHPSLDLSIFTEGQETQRRELASQLLEGLTEHGFVKIRGHSIKNSEVARLFDWSKRFFLIDSNGKQSIAHPGGTEPQRGFSRVGAENSSTLYRKGLLGSKVTEELSDAREHFDQGAKTDAQFPTRWPRETILPGFQKYMETAFEALEAVAAQIMSALEVALNLPRGAFLDKITNKGNASELRLNHYPAIDVKEINGGAVSRIWPHFDLGVITLLFQDSVGGLEFEDRKQPGNFVRVRCGDPAEMVVNVSETLQRWTNGNVRAGLHRVNVPENLEGKNSGVLPERYSIAYFCKADRAASVGSLKELVQEGCAPKYDELSAIEYHLQRLQSAY